MSGQKTQRPVGTSMRFEWPYMARQERLVAAMKASGLDGFALNPGPSLVYFTGLHFHLSERPVVFLISPATSPRIVLPGFEADKTDGLPFELQVFAYGEDPSGWKTVFGRGFEDLPDSPRLGVEPGRMRLLEGGLLESAIPGVQFVTAEDLLAEMRMVKEPGEIAALRQAVHIAQLALNDTMPLVQLGMTELELASELTVKLLRNGSEPSLPFHPIIAFGANSANPHAVPGDRRLHAGDLVILDWGANFRGYLSDLCRTFAAVQVETEFARIAQVVLEANQAARECIRPGIPAGEVDRVARSVIEQAGYGRAFLHRTGHGLGLDGHEPPYLFPENQVLLKPSMTFTIEPGIYLDRRGGVRIEDDFVVTPDGGESLSDLPRALTLIG